MFLVSLNPFSHKIFTSRIAVFPFAGVFKDVTPTKSKGLFYSINGLHIVYQCSGVLTNDIVNIPNSERLVRRMRETNDKLPVVEEHWLLRIATSNLMSF